MSCRGVHRFARPVDPVRGIVHSVHLTDTDVMPRMLRDGEGFLVVYSVCSRDTFERAEQIIKRVRRVKEEAATVGGAYHSGYPYSNTAALSPQGVPKPQGPIPIVIVGNKRDMNHLRDVQPEEGANLARRLGCHFFETSAKSGYNVENAFRAVVVGIKAAKGLTPVQAAGPGGRVGAGGRRRKGKRDCVVL